MSFELLLASPPEYCKNALLWGIPLAHMAYKTCGTQLYRTDLPDCLRRGLMMVTNTKPGSPIDCNRVINQILWECERHAFSGVIADFEPPCPFAVSLLPALKTELNRNRMAFYVSEWASGYVKDCNVVLSTAVSGGTLPQRLKDVAQVIGCENIVLDLEILSHDFLLPASNGKGNKIPRKRLNELIDYTGLKPQYSDELCCNYFSYKDRQGLHFVLFDDAFSVSKKIELAMRLGINKGILLYPEADSKTIWAALDY